MPCLKKQQEDHPQSQRKNPLKTSSKSPPNPQHPQLSLWEVRLAFDDLGRELDEEHGLAGPHLALVGLAHGVGGDPGGKGGAVADALDDAGGKGGAVELRHLARHADVGIDERLVVDDHILVWLGRVAALLEAVGLPTKKVRPHVDLDEVEESNDVERPLLRLGRLSVQEEVEELDADRVALDVEPGGRAAGG